MPDKGRGHGGLTGSICSEMLYQNKDLALIVSLLEPLCRRGEVSYLYHDSGGRVDLTPSFGDNARNHLVPLQP